MSDRATRYLTRVDKYLGELHPDQRATFLRLQRKHWEELYRAWQAKIAGEDAADFILTIAGLDQRLMQQRAVA